MPMRLTIFANTLQTDIMAPHLSKGHNHDTAYDIVFSQHKTDDVIIQNGDDKKIFALPVRLGEILDYIHQQYANINIKNDRSIPIGKFDFDVHHRILKCPGHSDVMLTEKEADILIALYKEDQHTLSRDALLKTVWGYVDGIETHTLETHIYRLRQKIEPDPKKPQILITDHNVYRLNKS